MLHKSSKNKNEVMVIAVHIDNCMIATSSTQLINDFKAGLQKHVEVMDLGELHWMLGIEIK